MPIVNLCKDPWTMRCLQTKCIKQMGQQQIKARSLEHPIPLSLLIICYRSSGWVLHAPSQRVQHTFRRYHRLSHNRRGVCNINRRWVLHGYAGVPRVAVVYEKEVGEPAALTNQKWNMVCLWCRGWWYKGLLAMYCAFRIYKVYSWKIS